MTHVTPPEHLTPWFPRNTHPVRIGVYQRRFLWLAYFAYWDGRRWFGACHTPSKAVQCAKRSATQSLPWRGVKE